jgi:CRP/FNR family transcriptional regulator, cyclic AMP receptor protein
MKMFSLHCSHIFFLPAEGFRNKLPATIWVAMRPFRKSDEVTVRGGCHQVCSAPNMIKEKARQVFLETIPIFAGLDAAAIVEISLATEEAVFQAGDVIVREGDAGNRMFIIHSGRVEVTKNLAQPHETVLAVLGPTDFIGEMSIIECVRRSASVRATEKTCLFTLKGTDLYRLYEHRPDQYAIVILNIARDISRRLRAVDEKYAAISH